MTTQPDRLDKVLRAWLDEGLDAAPERAVGSALTQINDTRQRRELALLRRIPQMDVIHARPRPAWQIGALAATVALALMAAVLFMAQTLPQVGNAQRGPGVGEVVAGLPVPPDARQGGRVTGADVPKVLFEPTQAIAFRNLAGFTDAAAVTYAGVSTASQYVAAAISFPTAADASAAVAELDAGASVTPVTWVDGPFASLPEQDGDGFVRGGSYNVVIGPDARAGLLIVWRLDHRVLIAVGADNEAQADEASQSAITDAVRALADAIDRQSR